MSQLVVSIREYEGLGSMKVSKIVKVAGASLVGFCAVSVVADRANLMPLVAQAAGVTGAFLGSLVACWRSGVSRKEVSDRGQPLTHGRDSGPRLRQVPPIHVYTLPADEDFGYRLNLF
jgi:hypothetical protein